MASLASDESTKQRMFVVDPFCYRQFASCQPASSSYLGTIIENMTVEEFEQIVNNRYHSSSPSSSTLQDGYAPFCKHFFVENDFTSAAVNVLPINKENEHLLRSKYDARNERELPVLVRYFPKDLILQQQQALPVAKYLDLILYSREQIIKENDAQGIKGVDGHEDVPWGIVSIKAQNVDHELPMTPITMMRNSLGKAEGGSGVPLDRDEYMKSVNYWKDHANIS